MKKKTKNKTKQKIKTAGDIFLFPYKVKKVISTLSQSYGWGIKQLNVPDTWKITKGKDIKVMVIDTGYTTHPDLQGAMIIEQSKSFLSSEKNIEDRNGHSTHVCGIIGARDNESGMVGVAPECSIITVKVLGEDGSGDFDAICKALEYAIMIKPDVINMSLGSSTYNQKMHFLIKELHKMNIPIIAAAGNDGTIKWYGKIIDSINYPAKYPETISVLAYDKDGNPASFNSYGSDVDFSAPGVDIYSTWLNNEYANLSGTSMATPFMTGVVALLLAKHRKQEKETGKNDCVTVDQIKQHLIKYSNDKGVIGRDYTWGYGIVDIVKAITNDEVQIMTTTTPALQPPKPSNWLNNLFKKILGWISR